MSSRGPSRTSPRRRVAAGRGPRATAASRVVERTGGGEGSALGSASRLTGSAYFDTVARLVADVADALDHAHRAGVTHRDVKPANLLLAPDGRLSVNDFGLARVLEEPGVTQTGEFVGTPAYMSPEQVTAGRIPLDHRTDIYSLGATLYELLTLRPPFAGERRDQVLAQIVQKEPTPPRRLNPQVPRDLETVCLKALEKDPDRRYQTAGELAADLRRYVNRFAIAARRAGPVAKVRKWVKRNPALAAACGAVLLALGAAGGFAWQARASERERVTAEQKREDEVRAERLRGAMDRATLEAMGGRFDQAEAALAEAEQLGATAGEVRFLRGIIAYFRNDSVSAVRELKQAVVLLPDSVAAQGFLAMACNDLGDIEGFERSMTDCLAREPKSPDDFLFRGYARGGLDPAAGLSDVNEAIRRRTSPLALVIRAEIQNYYADDTGSPAEALLGVQAADQARDLLANDPTPLALPVWSRAIAHQVFKKAGQDQEAERFLRDAEPYVIALRSQRTPIALWARGVYHHTRHDSAGLDAVTRDILKLEPAKVDSWVAETCAASMYRQGRNRSRVETP